MTYSIGFTGTQLGMTSFQKLTLTRLLLRNFERHPDLVFHHGDCIGADAEAHQIALDLSIPIIIHPPINPSKRANCGGALEIREEKDYTSRNHDIVDEASFFIAAPATVLETLRSGTWATVRYARLRQTTVRIMVPS